MLEHLYVPPPVEPGSPAYVLLEAAADTDPLPELAAALEAAGIEDAVIADDTASRERLWRLREAHTEAISGRRRSPRCGRSRPRSTHGGC